MAYEPEAKAFDASLTAVEAHGMLNALSVACAVVSTLKLRWGKLGDDQCIELLSRAEEQLAFLTESLGDLVRGIPSDTRQFLDDLRQTD